MRRKPSAEPHTCGASPGPGAVQSQKNVRLPSEPWWDKVWEVAKARGHARAPASLSQQRSRLSPQEQGLDSAADTHSDPIIAKWWGALVVPRAEAWW